MSADGLGGYQPYPAYKNPGVEWLGEIPTHWEVRRLKHSCSKSALYGANIPSQDYVFDGVRFLRTTDITDDGQLLEDGAVYVRSEDAREYLLKDGDLLLSRSGTLGRSFVYDGERHGPCAYAGYLVRFVPNESLAPQFAFYFTKSGSFEQWLSSATISSTIGNVNGQKYANLALPLPDVQEQRAIAAFLDHKTAEIDTLIARKEQLIALLQEKRAALITAAVTRGLDPDVEMKDSGVEWLGEIPAHWEVVRLRYVTKKFVDYRGKTPEKAESGIPLVTARNIGEGLLDLSHVTRVHSRRGLQDLDGTRNARQRGRSTYN